jgi:acyl dehydratase
VPVDPAFAGRVYPPAEPYQVGREKLREFAAATGATHPACFDPRAAALLGHPDVVAAPTFVAVVAQRAEAAYIADPAAGIDFSRVVHAEESIRHHRPLFAGDTLTAVLHVAAIRHRRGVVMVTTEVHLHDADRLPVADLTSTLAIRLPPTDPAPSTAATPTAPGSALATGPTPAVATPVRATGPTPAVATPARATAAATVPTVAAAMPAAAAARPTLAVATPAAPALGLGPAQTEPSQPGAAPADAARPETAVAPRQALDAVEIPLTREDLVRYAGASGDFNPIHWSEAAARQAGLPGVIAHGMLTMGRVSQLAVNWAGDPGAVVEFAVRFARPVPVPDAGVARLVASGHIAALRDGCTTINFDVTLDGARVLGKAQAQVRSA